MIDVRPFGTLGGANHGWLNARHHFSFAGYHDPARMNWGALRVWNDDEIAAGTGFQPHPHRDMEIITYVREGAITHKDSMGNEGRTEAGDVQIMSAGTGVVHSEYNLEPETTTLFQIWIIPDRRGAKPHWGAKSFPKATREAGLRGAGQRPAAGCRQRRAAAERRRRGAGGDLEGRPDPAPAAGRGPRRLPGAGQGHGHGERRGARHAGRRRHRREDAMEITATEDAELVLVEVAAE